MTNSDSNDKGCENCGLAMKPIAYGYPGGDMIDAFERGEIVLGGCVVESGMPMWSCPACGHESGNLRMNDPAYADD